LAEIGHQVVTLLGDEKTPKAKVKSHSLLSVGKQIKTTSLTITPWENKTLNLNFKKTCRLVSFATS
tara:strand:+ start:4372 stop:4569 length:198 start_codon:yes stop_codon:yes gene_type:complete